MNLFRKIAASATLLALVVTTGASSVSAYSSAELDAANGLAAANVINDNAANPAGYNFASTILRNEAAKMAVNLDDSLSMKATCDNSFADVSATTPNTWTCGYVEALLDAGKVSANTNFNPLSSVTKSEATKMMLEAAGCTDVYTTAANWQAETVAFAADNNIIASFSDYNTPATRGFVFEVAYNAMNVCPVEEVECDSVMEALGICTVEEETTTEEEETTTEETVTSNEGASVKVSANTPVDGNIAANAPRTPLLIVDVTAGDTDLELDEAVVKYTGLSDSEDITDLAIYLDNDKVSDDDSWDENEQTLSFDSDTIIKAGETKSLVITAEVTDDQTNSVHQVTLTKLVSTAGELSGTPIAGAKFNPVSVTNTATIEFNNDKATKDLKVGEEGKIAGFKLEETSDDHSEAALLKSFTLEATSASKMDEEDDLANIRVLVDGVEVAKDLSVNSDDEIIVNLTDVVIPADDEIKVEVLATVTTFDQSNNTVQFVVSDYYIVGKNSNVSLSTTFEDVSNVLDIEGADVNVSFEKSDIDEATPDTDGVLVGTLTVNAVADYKEMKVRVKAVKTAGTGSAADDIKKVRLGTKSKTGTDTFEFDNIKLKAGETLTLPLTVDLEKDAVNGDKYRFEIEITSLEDDDNTYSEDSDELDDILSTNDFDNDLDINFANITFAGTDFHNRTLVVANGVETVIYRGNVEVGDAGQVTLTDIDFNATLDFGYGDYSAVDIDDLLKDVTLNVGGQTADADDISAAGLIEFSGIDFDIAAGSNNVEVTLTATLNNKDVNNGSVLKVVAVANSVEAEDENGKDDKVEIITDDINGTASDAVASTAEAPVDEGNGINATILNDRGILTITQVDNTDYEDDVQDVVLAGTSSAIAQLEIQAEYEDVEVDELKISIPAVDGKNFRTSFNSVKLVTADGLVVTAKAATVDDDNNTIISFEDFTVPATDKKVDAKIVADIKQYSTDGDTDVVNLGNIEAVLLADTDKSGNEYNNFKGADSKEQLTTVLLSSSATDTVTVVPVLVTATVDDKLGTNDKYAKIKFTIDKGSNDLDEDDVKITEIKLETAAANVVIRNDDNDSITITDATSDTLVLTAENDINNNDVFEFKVANDNDELRILKNGIKFTVDGSEYKINNDSVLDLGEYDAD